MGHNTIQNHMACDHCGLVVQIPALAEGGHAICPRCRSPILNRRPDTRG